jgi:hypothetical protein
MTARNDAIKFAETLITRVISISGTSGYLAIIDGLADRKLIRVIGTPASMIG